MRYFPVFLDLQDKTVVIVGATSAALAKARLVAKSPAKLVLIARNAAADFRVECSDLGADVITDDFHPAMLDGAALVYTATGDEVLDDDVVTAAHVRQIPANVVDRTEACDFITPALVERAPITIAISSDAQAPALSRHLKAKLDALLPSEIGTLGRLAEDFRGTVKSVFKSTDARRRFWDRLFDGALGHNETPSRQDVIRLINEVAKAATAKGRVAIVGAGPGDPDLLTLRAHRALQQADVIVHDKLVSDAVLDYARRDAERIYVGKSRGNHSLPQEGINELLIRLARAGKYVVRLKGGDPFIFGRGGEEVDALYEAGVAVDVVPGITAASGCAAENHISLTHRDFAHAVTYVAGQRKGLEEQDWRGLVGEGRTLVIYMGLSNAPAISRKLMEAGAAAQLPVAVVENGTRPDSRHITTTVAELPQALIEHGIESPSLLIVGEVARARQNLASALPQMRVAVNS